MANEAVITPGDGSEQPTNLGLSLQELEDLQDQPNPNQEGTQGTEGEGEGEPNPAGSGTNEEGSEGGEEGSEEDKNTEGVEGSEEGTQDEAPSADEFFGAVNALHGAEIKVEYPEGVDPLTPEGIHIREKALLEMGALRFEEHLKTTDPTAYAYFLHRQSGGDEASWSTRNTSVLPVYDTFKDSVDLQKKVLIDDLLTKGLDKEDAEASVERAITQQKLFEKADAAYKAREEADQKALNDATAAAQAREQKERDLTQSMVSGIEDIVLNSKLDKIVIPDAKRAEFSAYLKENLYYDGENFFLTKPLSKDSLATVIQGEYFHFVKGNLGDLVERKAQTQTALRLKNQVAKTKASTPSGGTSSSNKAYVPLSAL